MARPKTTFAGIDVGSRQLHLALVGVDDVAIFDNTSEGRQQLLRFLKKRGSRLCVALESTGTYGLDLALTLHADKRIEVKYVNPARAKSFSDTVSGRAKTDRVDAHRLAALAASVPLPTWQPPPQRALAFRSLTRRIRTLVNDRTREKNRLEAIDATEAFPEAVRQDIEAHIRQLDERIERLREAAVAFAREHADWAQDIDLMVSVKGIGEATAAEILGELVCLPPDLTARQAVAHAGLDPRAKQSGVRDGKRSISKMGSRYLRAALYIAAINTVRWTPEVRAFHDVLVNERKKPRTVAYVAVARKLLHTLLGMLETKTAFEPHRFYRASQPDNVAA
jgi:transposase